MLVRHIFMRCSMTTRSVPTSCSSMYFPVRHFCLIIFLNFNINILLITTSNKVFFGLKQIWFSSDLQELNSKIQFHKQKEGIKLFYDLNYILYMAVMFYQETFWCVGLLYCMKYSAERSTPILVEIWIN